MVVELQQARRKRQIKYSPWPKWLVPLAGLTCILSGATWLGLKTGGLPDLRPVREAIESAEARHYKDIYAWRRVNSQAFMQIQTVVPARVVVDRTLWLLMLVCLASGGLALVGKDARLTLNGRELLFPYGMMPELVMRRRRTWSDISAILLETDPKSHSRSLVIYFHSGGKAGIDLRGLSSRDLESLLLGLDEWASQCAIAPAVVGMRHEVLCDRVTRTSLWQDELASHFAATNFVPLSPGALLQEGGLRVIMHSFSGGMSAVYLAERPHSPKSAHSGAVLQPAVVVVKESVIPPAADAGVRAKAREMFRREAKLLMNVHHERVAKVLDHFVENDRDYLVLEYLPGLSLRQLVSRNGPQDEEQVLRWAAEIAGVLAYLHNLEVPIVHRDLTPDNLIVAPDGKLYLIDFGAANFFVGAATGTVVGKQLYIAPEQFRGKAVPASDIYALGATMHYLLTGCEPEALSVSSPRALRPDLSPAVDDLVRRCTEQELSERTESADRLLAELNALSSHSAPVLKVPQPEAVSVKVRRGARQAV